MRCQALLILAVGFLGASPAPADDPAKNDKAKFAGTWSLVSVEINKQTLIMDPLKDAKLVVKGDKYSFTLGKVHLEMTHKVDASKKPRTLDLTITEGANKGKTLHAIYKLKGDILTICRHTEPGQARPTEFATKPDSGLMLIVWKRNKS
jgi:uncharacterized protein (TIGR03067 family)